MNATARKNPRPALRQMLRPPRPLPMPLAITSALLALFAATPVLAEVRFVATDMGTLGGATSTATGINAAGVVVGSTSLGDGTPSAFVWKSGSLQALGYSARSAAGINDAGAVVGITSDNHAFLKDAPGGGYDLGTLGGTYSGANAINAGGLIAGYGYTSGDAHFHATLWQPLGASRIDLGTLSGSATDNSNAYGINAAGQVVGFSTVSGGFEGHAVIWQSGGVSRLGELSGGTTSFAYGINATGQVVGLSNDASGLNKAVLWQNGGVQSLGTLGGATSAALAINDAGLIVGQSYDSVGGSRAFLRTAVGGMRDLNGLLVAGSSATVTRANAINADGQIAGNATFAGQSHAVLLTPTGSVAWQASIGGSFNSAANWEQGFGTSSFLDASIAPTGTQTVLLGADAAVKSLSVGGVAGSSGRPTLMLQSGASLTAAGGVTVQATGTLTGDGTVRGDLVNLGTVQAANVSITGSFSNAGVVSGSGIVNASLNNAAAGQVRTGAGEYLHIIGASHTNGGTLDLSGGGTQQYTGALANAAGGRILLNNAVLRLDNGLSNAGQVQVSYGGATVYGAVTTHAGGAVIMSGNSHSTFYDGVDVESGGELRVSEGSTAVFFGQVNQRTGAVFSGTGTKFYEGGLSIGNSPGLGADAGSVAFGTGNTYLEEIGGTTAGTGFDKYVVAGDLGFGGTLKVVSWNGFAGQSGQHFDLFDWGTSSGTFAAVDLSGASLAKGLSWDTSQLYSTGELSITGTAMPVPEPGTWALMLAGCGLLTGAVRRRSPRRG